MNKYKKIFSGLGLLSISTLIGASVVACANKKPKPSDSSTEGIDQNNNQGNSTTPEQGKPEMPQNPAPGTDHNNQEKNEDSTGKDNNGKTELEKDKKPEKTPEQGQNDKQKENKDESDKSDSNQIKKENEGKNTTPKDGKEQMPPKVMTVDEKVQELNSLVEKFPYPETEDKAETETKTFLKSKVELIKNKPNQSEEQKIIELNELETIFKEYEGKINKYKAIINNDKFKSNKYNPNGLNGRLAKLFGEDPEGKYTESELIWQIYETFRRSAFVNPKISHQKYMNM
ncbi:hypothetical protein OM999_03680 [Mycoplasmopsis cynos]|nr:hypothetical protein OM999_03680 [Mycoplasmopsis cynos]